MPASTPFGFVVERDVEATLLGPSGVHPQQHLGEVLGVDATVLGVDLHDARRVVVLAGEQAAQLEQVEFGCHRADLGFDVGLLGGVVYLTGHLVQYLGVIEATRQRVERVDVVFHVGVLGVHALGEFGVVPQIGPLHLRFELGQPVSTLVDLQIDAGLVEAAMLLAQVIGEVTHIALLFRPRRGRA